MEVPPQQLLPCFQDSSIVDVTDRLGVEDADQGTKADQRQMLTSFSSLQKRFNIVGIELVVASTLSSAMHINALAFH